MHAHAQGSRARTGVACACAEPRRTRGSRTHAQRHTVRTGRGPHAHAGGALHYGYRQGGGSHDIKRFINETWLQRHGVSLPPDRLAVLWSFIISIYCLGGLLGCLWSGSLSVRYGKKKTFTCSNFIIIVGALLIGSSKMAGSFEVILMGRFLYGISAGLCLNIHGPYLGEISPKKFRGLTTTTAAIFFSLGKALGQILGLRFYLGNKDQILGMSGLVVIPIKKYCGIQLTVVD
uniref:Major facilitator superfamily (MFS) profile domain-containing protein n=1 Tax=Pseudonaja textilis TaxID=8673 RepID=A0A670ZVS6_PSETE